MSAADFLEFPVEELCEGDEEVLKDNITELYNVLRQTFDDYEDALQGGGAGNIGVGAAATPMEDQFSGTEQQPQQPQPQPTQQAQGNGQQQASMGRLQ